jgi:tetratricopeptide (TPR) repeat protein
VTDLDRELALRLRVRRDTLLLAVVGDGPTAALQAWRALRRAGPAEATADVAALAALPPGTTVLHALTPDQAHALNLYRNALSGRPLRVVLCVERADLAVIRDRAPDLWDWVAHVWFVDAEPWPYAVRALRGAALGGVPVVFGGPADVVAAAGLGAPLTLDPSAPWERLGTQVRAARVRWWRDPVDSWGAARLRWAEAEAAAPGLCLVAAAVAGWPACEVPAAPMTLRDAALALSVAGLPLSAGLDVDLAPDAILALATGASPEVAPAPPGEVDRVADVLRSGLSGAAGAWCVETARDRGHADLARSWARRLIDDPDPEVRWSARLSLADAPQDCLAEARADGAVVAAALADPDADPGPVRHRSPRAWLQLRLARAHEALRHGEPAVADAAAAELAAVAATLGEPRLVARVWGLAASLAHLRGDLDGALHIHQEHELPLYRGLGDTRAEAAVLGGVADVLTARGAYDEALDLRLRCEFPVYARTGDARERAVALGKVANILQLRGQLDEALRLRREGLAVFEAVGDHRERAVTLGKIADILLSRGEVDEALRLYRDEQLPAFEALGAPRERAMTLGKIADVAALRGQLDEALRLHRDEELPTYERLGAVRERAIVLGRIADLLEARGDRAEALRLHRDEELPLYERLGMVRERAVALGRIADLAHRAGRLDEALRVRLTEELPVYEQLGDVRAVAVTRGKVADVQVERGELEPALAGYQAALRVLEELGDVRGTAGLLGRVAHVHARRGELHEALRIRTELQLPALERLGDVRELVVARTRVAELLRATGRPEEADALRASAVRAAKASGFAE